ncbi:MAG: putative exported protein [Verrucomicrobia bacterium]|nr:putative exported protein [Verrucomicrobiota bacterium]
MTVTTALIRHRIFAALSAVVVLCASHRLAAQELTLLGGTMQTDSESSYTFQLDYRQNFTRFAAASVAYINEGHVVGHHRDGTAFELLGRLPLFKDKIAFAAGVGYYYFYDTQPGPLNATVNVHGTAPIYTLSATAYLSNRWYLRGIVNRISPRNNIQTTTFAAGLGFWFGRDVKPTKGEMGDNLDVYKYVTDPELDVFIGQSIVNTFLSETARAYGAQYRQGIMPHVDGTVTFIYEGDPEIIRRNGVALQVWAVNTFHNERVSVGVGVGPYIYIDRKNPSNNNQLNPAAVAPLVSFTVATRLNEHWMARLIFNRVTSSYNRDADVFLLGLGYRWGDRI